MNFAQLLTLVAVVVLAGLGADAARRPLPRPSPSTSPAAASSSALDALPDDVLHMIVKQTLTDLSSVASVASVSRQFRQYVQPMLEVVSLFGAAGQHGVLADRVRTTFRRGRALTKFLPLPPRLVSHAQALGLYDALRDSQLSAAMRVSALQSLVAAVPALRDVIVAVDVAQDSATLLAGLARLPPGPVRPVPADLPAPIAAAVISIAASFDENAHGRFDADTVARFRAFLPPALRRVFPHNNPIADRLLRHPGITEDLQRRGTLEALAQVGIRFRFLDFLYNVRVDAGKVAEFYPLLRRRPMRTAQQITRNLLPVCKLLLNTESQSDAEVLCALLDVHEVRDALARAPGARVTLLNFAIRRRKSTVLKKMLAQPDIGDVINGAPGQQLPLVVALRTSEALFTAMLEVRGLDFVKMEGNMGRPAPAFVSDKSLSSGSAADTSLSSGSAADTLLAGILLDPSTYLRRLLKARPQVVPIALRTPQLRSSINVVLEPRSGRTILHIAFQRHLDLVPALLNLDAVDVLRRDTKGLVPFAYLSASIRSIAKFFRTVAPAQLAILVRSDLRHLFRLLSAVVESRRDGPLLPEIFALSFWPHVINFRDPRAHDRTLLHMAIEAGRYGLVQHLLSVEGASAGIVDRDGRAPIEILSPEQDAMKALKDVIPNEQLVALTSIQDRQSVATAARNSILGGGSA